MRDGGGTHRHNLENKIDILESKVKQSHKCNVSDMEETILQLRMEIDSKDQITLINDVEIASSPEVTDENTIHSILIVAIRFAHPVCQCKSKIAIWCPWREWAHRSFF